jgi:hypothetical protein
MELYFKNIRGYDERINYELFFESIKNKYELIREINKENIIDFFICELFEPKNSYNPFQHVYKFTIYQEKKHWFTISWKIMKEFKTIIVLMQVDCSSFTKIISYPHFTETIKTYYYYSFAKNKSSAINQISETIDFLITNTQKFSLLNQIKNLEFKLYYCNKNQKNTYCLYLPGYKVTSYYANLRFALRVFQHSHI